MQIFVLPFLLLCSALAHATELQIQNDETPVYSEPSKKSAPLGYLPKGKRVHSSDEEDAFIRIRSRTDRQLWIEKTHAAALPPSDGYDVVADAQSEVAIVFPTFKRLRLDMGAAGGSVSGQGFVEGALGLEYFMMERLSWRNAVFYRVNRVNSDIYGIDSSARGNGNLSLGTLKLRGIIGAGFRFATRGQEAPFAEVGGFARLTEFELGFMLKYLLPLNSTNPSVAIYSLVFSGSTGFF